MKIAIATPGRFHVLDLARELDRLSVDVSFYSYVPKKRAQRFGLPAKCHISLLPLIFPFVIAQHYFVRIQPARQERLMAHAFNRAVIARLKQCDVFIGMSGMLLEAAKHARKRFGAQIWLERGSRHILSQRDILAGYGATRPTDFMIERELEGYEIADRIVVPSSHVVESFVERDSSLVPKLFVNPYGVDLTQFPMNPRGPATRTILFVGGWSFRKGVDVLTQAVRRVDDVRLIHVGNILDHPFPQGDPRFVHVDPVPQWELEKYYATADLFAIASREEGLSMVQAQALASGLPLVCTTRTGGADLRFSDGLRNRISVVEPDEVEALARALEMMLSALEHGELPQITAEDRQLLSWSEYGRRYRDALLAAEN